MALQRVGGLWRREFKGGSKGLGGTLSLEVLERFLKDNPDAEKVNILVLPNSGRDDNDRAPDFNIQLVIPDEDGGRRGGGGRGGRGGGGGYTGRGGGGSSYRQGGSGRSRSQENEDPFPKPAGENNPPTQPANEEEQQPSGRRRSHARSMAETNPVPDKQAQDADVPF